MGFITRKFKLLGITLFAVGSSLVAYNNCSNKTFTASNDTIQRLLSEGASIFINDDATYTKDAQVYLTIENNSAKEMYITNKDDCSDGGQWETYATSKVWMLGQTNARTKVYVKFREDESGPESVCTWDGIIHDNIPPQLNLVSGAPAITNSPSVGIRFTAIDALSGVKTLSCKDQKGMSLSGCQENLNLTGIQEGPGSVSIVAEDNAGNTSAPLVQTWLADFTAPKVFINSAPSSITNQMNGFFGFSGTDNFASSLVFECSLNSASFSVCNSPLNFSLNQGNHVFQVRAKDNAGNTSSVVSYNWTIDLTVPAVRIVSGPANFSNSRSATFVFDGTDDGKAITKFECSIDSGPYTKNCSSPATYNSLSDGPHRFEVIGFDQANNPSAPAVYSWTVDTAAPTISITARPDAESAQTTALFQFVATDSGTGIKETKCRIDGGTFQVCNNSATYPNLTEGSHTFQVQAVDLAGNTSATASYTWFVDVTPPQLSFLRTPASPTKMALAEFEMRATDNSPSAVNLECRLDAATTYSACTPMQTLAILTDGIHNFSVRAIDRAGNMSATINHSWLLDTTPPSINFTDIPPTTLSVLDIPKVGYIVEDVFSAITSTQCGLNGSLAACPVTQTLTFNNLTAGSYTFEVRATDALGNSATRSVSWSITNNIRAVSQSVTVNNNNKADILIVIDNSGSMAFEQKNMATRFATFLDKLNGLDWRVAIVTTDVSSNADKRDGRFLPFADLPGQYFIHAGMDLNIAKNSFGKTIQRPASEGSANEQGIAASLRAMQRSQDPVSVLPSQPNRDFFRADAALSVLVVSDANETNPLGTQTQNRPDNWVNYIRTTWPSKTFIFSSIIVRSGDNACRSINGNEGFGTSYEQLVSLTGGEVGSVCATDYGSQLTRMGQSVVDLVKNINLNCAPVDQNKNGNTLDDILVTTQGGALAPLNSLSGQTLTLVNLLPSGTHRVDYWCLQ
jgi:hypothetical protein